MLEKVLTGELTFSSMKPCDLSNCTKDQIKAYLQNSYDLHESIYTCLADESVMYRYPDRLRLPLLFYYGHTASVYINKLILGGLLTPKERINFEFECLFETGVDEMSWDDTENYRMGGKFQWPSVDDVIDYRQKVRKLILDVIDRTPLELPVTIDSPWWAVFMGMEHERIHIETSSVLLRQLPVSMVTKPEGWIYGSTLADEEAGPNVMLTMETSTVTFGKPKDFPSYGWDNEYGKVTCRVPAFQASKYLVTNREMLEFVQSGGYGNSKFWTNEGWQWAQYCKVEHPTFWVCENGCPSGCGANLAGYSHCKPAGHLNHGQNSHCNGHMNADSNGHQGVGKGSTYRLRQMFDVVDLPLDWPAEVNYHEARAFCAWKGPDYRLISESEHHVIRGDQPNVNTSTSCDIIYCDDKKLNINMTHGSPTPVNLYSPTSAGFYDVFGNIWEWAEDHFNGLPGFKTVYLYDDFSTPCFDGLHNMILGGSWISTGDEASRFARFSFRRHFFQHLGFRLARTLATSDEVKLPIKHINTDVYVVGLGKAENPPSLDENSVKKEASVNKQYQYEAELDVSRAVREEYQDDIYLYQEQANICNELINHHGIQTGKALHIGCATGRITFQLTNVFDQVLGQDFCGQFIEVCHAMQKNGRWSGDEQNTAILDEEVDADKVVFKQLTWLPNEVGFFDFILASNLERLQNIKAWLARLPEILLPHGLLITCCTQEFSPKLHQDLVCRFTPLVEHTLPSGSGDLMMTAWCHTHNREAITFQ